MVRCPQHNLGHGLGDQTPHSHMCTHSSMALLVNFVLFHTCSEWLSLARLGTYFRRALMFLMRSDISRRAGALVISTQTFKLFTRVSADKH